MKKFKQIKIQICQIGKMLYDKGFVPGSSGNISHKTDNTIIITPSGSCLGKLSTSDLVKIDLDGNLVDLKGKPSSEKLMHVEIYKRRPDISAIIHAHPPKSTALSVAGKEIKAPLIAEAVVTLGEIPLVKYETPSSFELAQNVADCFIGHEAVLMANHGVTVCGKSLEKAYYKMETVEFTSEIYLITELLNKRNEIPAEKLPDLIKIREQLELTNF
ncbi:MAG TPA: class II aldolase/adducin family protein [Candidatus Gastranaerophilales bacterium]|nr:class II aldolase/adducin family protein [Candidatus Gastranaerophilales bacterium]